MIDGWIATLRRRFSQDALFWLCAVTVILLIPILLAVAWRATSIEQAQQDAAQAAMIRSAERRASIQAFALMIKDAESSHRGYLLSGDHAFLRRYEAVTPLVEQRIDQLVLAFSDQPEQQQRLARVRELARERFALMEEVRAVRDERGLTAAGAEVATARGERAMERLRADTDAISAAEARNLGERLRLAQSQTRQARLVSSTSYGLVLAAIALAAVMAFRYTALRTALITRARAEAERRQAIFDSAMDAIITFNPSGGVETMNRAAQEMFGYAPEELTGRDISVLVPEAAGDDALFLERLRHDGDVRAGATCELEARRKDGTTFPVDINFGEMAQPDGVHAVAVMRDCTERRRAELAKSEFVSTVSHELRTPLTSIAGSLGLLAGGAAGALPERAARLIGIAENNSRRLVRLINDILDLEKIDSGKLGLVSKPLDFGDLTQAAVENLGGLSAETGVALAYDPPAEPVMVDGDADRLTQVLTNLLSNAVKFSRRGGVARVRVWPEGRRVRLSVKDDGPGIPPEFQDQIFGRFAQADSSDTRQKGGTGLGLAISKEIVERHGGRIWFESPPGEGATFHVELPARPDVASAPPGDDGVRLLLCEDDPDIAQVLSEALAGHGFRTEIVTTLAAATETLATPGAFDALLLDLRLPDGSGLDLLRRLRADPATRGLPAIIISADAADRAAMASLDLVDWIEKPVDLDRLAAALDQAIDGAAEGPLVLHVDDDPDLRQLVAEAFSGRCRMKSVESLAAARQALSEQTPSLAILDVGLPDGSGLDLLPELHDPSGRPIPVVVFSAQAFDQAALAQAVDAVLVKSRSSLDQLIATVRRLTAVARHSPSPAAGAEA
ncbi:ATP-binding protein [Phenylobacterium sp. VNQ135]|uniref:ATP-binding protein n=1 Tax=Phenylobacterium sp. VNQ135 TaxID=3400922 RepID=UPI003C0FB533